MTPPDPPQLSPAGRRAVDQARSRELRVVSDDDPWAENGTAQESGEGEQHHGQLRFAERFISEHADKMLHVHGIGWHEFDGHRWAECQDGGQVRAVKATIDHAVGELVGMDKKPRTDLMQDIMRVQSHSGMQGVLGIAGTLHPCTLAAPELDADPYLLNTAEGCIDLNDSSSRAARPADHLSKVTKARHDPGARAEVFDRFIGSIQPDKEARDFIARSLGSALLGVVREQRLFIWHGTGRNGKGTLRDAVLHALGDYSVEVPADILLASKYGASHLAPERMRLKGTRMAFCSEIPEGARMDEATMKKLTGGDPVTGKLLYRNPVEFQPSHTLFMLTNFLPVVRGDDPAVWRRILAVPFDVVVDPKDVDQRLPEKLKECPDAVFAWLWRGWLDYCEQGLNPPESVLAATRAYERDSDILARFLGDQGAVVIGHGSASSSELYGRFKEWTRAEGEPTEMTNKAFTEAMRKRGFERRRSGAGVRWHGICLAGSNDHEESG